MLNDILSQEQLDRLKQLIAESESIVLCCHQNPDGDALGSCLAWAEVLKTVFGKTVELFVPDLYPDYLQWMPNTEKIIRYDKHREGCDFTLAHADLIFCLDFNTASRTADMEAALVASPAKKVLIDHHLDPAVDTVLTISHPEASSTCELVFRLVWQLGCFDQLTKHFAVPLYCGMMTDTGAFTYNSNRAAVYDCVSRLMERGVDKDMLYRKIFWTMTPQRLRLQGYLLYTKMQLIPGTHAAYMTLTNKERRLLGTKNGDTEGIVNLPLQISGMKLTCLMSQDTEHPEQYRISLRSVDDFPCNRLSADFFDGGGHKNAAGGRFTGSEEEAIEQFKKAVKAYEQLLR